MNEDEKMFQIGLWMLGGILLLTIALQVCYRTQNKARDRVRAQIVQTQQEIAARQANFASFVRPESLRNLISMIAPQTEVISFHKTVAIDEIPNRVIPEKEEQE